MGYTPSMERRAYTSDLTDAQWQVIEPLLPRVLRWGRPRKYSYREILNGIFYVLRSGCQWRDVPHDLPPWSLVHYYYCTWRHSGRWKTIHDALAKQVRREAGKEESPSAGVIDSQSVKTTETSRAEGEKGGFPASQRLDMTRERRSKGASGTLL